VERLWVAELIVSPRTAEKINARHELAVHEVRDVVVCVRGLRFTWHHDPDRGWRAMVETSIRDRRALVVLYPFDTGDDCWHLGSVYFV
jgi:hypothetical protein